MNLPLLSPRQVGRVIELRDPTPRPASTSMWGRMAEPVTALPDRLRDHGMDAVIAALEAGRAR